MNVGVSAEEIVEALREGYPKEYSIIVLSIINTKQADLIASIQAELNALKPVELEVAGKHDQEE